MSLKQIQYSSAVPKLPPLVVGGFVLLLTLVAGWFAWNAFFASPSDKTIQNCESISRETYGVSPAIFELLPPPPACFYTIVNAYRAGTFTNPFFFDEKYYTQPEFFPLFQHEKFRAWKEPSPDVWAAIGYGAFPTEFNLSLLPGETTRVRFFMFTSAGVRTYQGMRLGTEFPNPADANHISVKIISDAADGFILGPSFPKFSPIWARAVDVEITAAKNIPPETLRLFFRVKSPSSKLEEASVQKYGTNYYPATAYVGERNPVAMKVTILPEEPVPVFYEAIK